MNESWTQEELDLEDFTHYVRDNVLEDLSAYIDLAPILEQHYFTEEECGITDCLLCKWCEETQLILRKQKWEYMLQLDSEELTEWIKNNITWCENELKLVFNSP